MASNSQSLLLDVVGDLPIFPEVRISPTVQRTTPVANAGWKFRHRIQVTNTGDEAWFNHPYPLNIGVTTDEVLAGTMLASGNDIRVWHNGLEIARTLNSHNVGGTQTFVWIVIPFLDVGASTVYDVVYGNASAGSPPTLTNLDDLAAFDIAGTGATRSTATFWRYLVDRTVANAGKGGWALSSGTQEPVPGFGVPGSWQLVSTRDSSDDRRQTTWSAYTATGTKYQARFDAIRARLEALVFDRDTGSDGVSIRSGAGIASVRCDLRYQNLAVGDTDVTPIGKLVILARAREGDEWAIVFESAALQTTETTIATATYAMPTGTKEVAFAVWPNDGLVVNPGARPDRFVYGAWFTTLELTLSNAGTQTFLETAQEIYELATELRVGGGGDTTAIPPYKSVLLGNAKQASGVGTPRMACKLNEIVRVFCETKRVEIWNSALTAKVEDVPIPAVRAVQGVLQADRTTAEQVSEQWLPLEPVVNPLTNPTFDVDALNWTQTDTDVLMVPDPLVRDTVIFSSSPGSGKLAIPTNTGGTGDRVVETANDYLPVGNRQSVYFGADLRASNLNLIPRLEILFYDAAQVVQSITFAPTYAVLAINTWYRRLYAALVPAGAVYYRVAIDAFSSTANQTGTIWFDTVAVNDTEIALLDVASGTLTLSAVWKERYVGG